jgi:hypothetical protein
MGIEPCLKQFSDDKRFRGVPKADITSSLYCRPPNILGEQCELSHRRLRDFNTDDCPVVAQSGRSLNSCIS